MLDKPTKDDLHVTESVKYFGGRVRFRKGVRCLLRPILSMRQDDNMRDPKDSLPARDDLWKGKC